MGLQPPSPCPVASPAPETQSRPVLAPNPFFCTPQEDLYRSLAAQDLRLYRSVLQSMQLAPVARGGRQPAVPLRVYLRSGGRGERGVSGPAGCPALRAPPSVCTAGYTACPAEHRGPSRALPGRSSGAPAGLYPLLTEALCKLYPDWPAPSFLLAGYLSSYEGIAYTSRSVESRRPDGTLVSLGEALRPLVADYAGAAAGAAAPAATPPAPAGGPPAGPAAGAAGASEAALATEDSGTEEAGEGAAERSGASGAGSAGGEEARDTSAAAPTGSPAAAQPGPSSQEWQQRQWGEEPGQQGGPEFTALVGGVSPPLETAVAWLHANMHAADYFLYVVVHVGRS